MLRAAFCLLLALAGAASAQDHATLDVEVPAGDDRLRQNGPRGVLSVTPTGTYVIALERSVVLTDRRGRVSGRFALAAADRKLDFVCLVAVDDKDIAVLYRYAEGAGRSGLVLARHGSDGRLKRERHIPTTPVDVEHCVPTRDHALMFAGNEAGGSRAWWFAKVSLDGVRVFGARATGEHPERLASIGSRPGGHWYALVQRLKPGGAGTLDWFLNHYVDGKVRAQLRLGLANGGPVAAMLEQGGVIAADGDTLYVLDDLASILREASWPFARTASIVGGDDGFWAIVSDAKEGPDKLVRVNAKGDIRWQHEPMRIAGIARDPDNQVVLIVASEDGRQGRLLRFDHRSGIEHLP